MPIMQTEAMDTVLVTGGTGHLGQDLVTRLKRSCRVRVLARSAGSDPEVEWFRGDLATGDGIAEAVVGSQTVIHAATLSPAARRGYIVPKDLWSSPSSVDLMVQSGCWTRPLKRVSATSSTSPSWVLTSRESPTCGANWRPNP